MEQAEEVMSCGLCFELYPLYHNLQKLKFFSFFNIRVWKVCCQLYYQLEVGLHILDFLKLSCYNISEHIKNICGSSKSILNKERQGFWLSFFRK